MMKFEETCEGSFTMPQYPEEVNLKEFEVRGS
jgi:hypothetical protein